MVAVFWRHGYDGTTMRMLEEATGIGIRGIANVFGDKDAIFVRVLQAYRIQAQGILTVVFDPPSLDAIAALFQGLTAPRDSDDPANCGCLMVNTVLGLGRIGEAARAEVEGYRAMFQDTFEQALSAEAIPDAEARATFLVNTLWGALAQIRLAGSTTAAGPMAAVAIETVNGWRSNAAGTP